MKNFKNINKNGCKTEYRKGTKWNERTYSWYLECKCCNEMTRISGEGTGWVICWKCTSISLKDFGDVRN